MVKVPNDKKCCPKLQPSEWGAQTLQTGDRQTDGFAIAKTRT